MGTSPSAKTDVVIGAWIDPSGRRAEWVGLAPLVPDPLLAPVDPSVSAPARVLVVEDEHLVALDIQQNLSRLGHVSEVVYSGEDAVARATSGQFDLVLMDVRLGGQLDGIEAAASIRRQVDVPIIYLTAYADNDTLDRARITEPYGYLLKPFQERELKAAIEMALQRHSNDKMRWEQQQLQRFLADASARMAASLDFRSVARGAAELLVPRYADWCAIHLKDTNDTIPAYSFVRPDGDVDTVGRTPRLIENVQRNARPEILTQVSDPNELRDALGSQHLDVLRELGARSLVCVPLVARGQVLGALALVAGRSRPRYAGNDLAFAEDFAHRLAMALDNALLYRKAERAIAMRDDVLAIVSHDLRTPLGNIVLQAEAIAANPAMRKAASVISHAAQRMNRLIGDLLDASAINAGQLALDQHVHPAGEVAREALEMFRSHAEAREIDLTEAIDDVPKIYCDRDRIVQLLANLIGNAVKFTPRGGAVTITVIRQASGVRFEVCDNGPGIAEDQVPHLFDRFWRAHAHRTGAGLGLFIARGIAAAHGSELAVETKLGDGAKFFFHLPEVAT
jgi:signal transduction histidine kinase/CheY-like chemotaxis protein